MYKKIKLDVWKRPNCTGNEGRQAAGKDLESLPAKEGYLTKCYYMVVIMFNLVKKVY